MFNCWENSYFTVCWVILIVGVYVYPNVGSGIRDFGFLLLLQLQTFLEKLRALHEIWPAKTWQKRPKFRVAWTKKNSKFTKQSFYGMMHMYNLQIRIQNFENGVVRIFTSFRHVRIYKIWKMDVSKFPVYGMFSERCIFLQ